MPLVLAQVQAEEPRNRFPLNRGGFAGIEITLDILLMRLNDFGKELLVFCAVWTSQS